MDLNAIRENNVKSIPAGHKPWALLKIEYFHFLVPYDVGVKVFSLLQDAKKVDYGYGETPASLTPVDENVLALLPFPHQEVLNVHTSMLLQVPLEKVKESLNETE